MYKRLRIWVTYLVFSLALAWNVFAASRVIPADGLGSGQAVFGEPNTYKVQLVFQLKNVNQAFNDGGAFVVTLPGSDDYQNVTVTSVQGIAVRDIYRDAYGNVVLLSQDIEPHSLPQNVKIVMNVTTKRTKVNKSMTSDGSAVSELFKSGDKAITKADLFQLAEEYRTYINGKAVKNKNRIYQQKIFDLFPIEDSVYHDAMAGFARSLAEQGVTALMVYGWNVPEKTDYIARDFALKVVTSDCGIVYLNKMLKEYSSDGTHVWWNVLPPKYAAEYDNNFLYAGVGQPVEVDGQKKLSNIISFIGSTMYLSIGKIKAQGVEARFTAGYDKISVTPKSKNPQKIILLKTKLSKYPDQFVLFKSKGTKKTSAPAANTNNVSAAQHKAPNTAQSGIQQCSAVNNQYITNITFCKNVDNGKAVSPQQTFLSSDTVYVLIGLKSTKQAKEVYYQWLTPSGKNHFKKTTTVPGNWATYYTYTSANGKMEKGVWKFIITINGVSKSVSFTVQ